MDSSEDTLITRLNEIAECLGIQFVDPQKIIDALKKHFKCSDETLFGLLRTGYVQKYISEKYGHTLKLQ